jgi:hypothetical protein
MFKSAFVVNYCKVKIKYYVGIRFLKEDYSIDIFCCNVCRLTCAQKMHQHTPPYLQHGRPRKNRQKNVKRTDLKIDTLSKKKTKKILTGRHTVKEKDKKQRNTRYLTVKLIKLAEFENDGANQLICTNKQINN